MDYDVGEMDAVREWAEQLARDAVTECVTEGAIGLEFEGTSPLVVFDIKGASTTDPMCSRPLAEMLDQEIEWKVIEYDKESGRELCLQECLERGIGFDAENIPKMMALREILRSRADLLDRILSLTQTAPDSSSASAPPPRSR
jgi:hypothetical protein